jgi:hypothetical protein
VGFQCLILDLGARRWWVVSATPRPHYPRERTGTHCTGGWVDPRASLDVCEKISPPPWFFFVLLRYSQLYTIMETIPY